MPAAPTRFAIGCLALLLGPGPLQPVLAQVPSTWKQIGGAGAYRNSLAVNGMNGRFYSIESDGTLYSSDLNGSWTQIGKSGEYAGTTMFLAVGGRIYNVQRGTLYATDPSSGIWVQIGDAGDWANTVLMAGMDGYLWSFERNGSLYRTDQQGTFAKVERGSLHPQMLAAMGGKLWAIEDATLWSLDPSKGDWDLLGDPGDFEDTFWFIASTDYLWELDHDGTLYRGDAADDWTKMGRDGEYQSVRRIIAMGNSIYAIKDGTMYRIQ
jgi:hypothetical protein